MSLGGVHRQADDLGGLQRSVGSGVPVALVVAEDAIVQRAPAATELCREAPEDPECNSVAGLQPRRGIQAPPTFSAFAVRHGPRHGTGLEQEAVERNGGLG